jgi:hypothetical protein
VRDGGFVGWVREGARSLVFRRPRWERLHPTPAVVALLVLLELGVAIGWGRQYLDDAATFNWQAGLAGWASLLLLAWACYVLRRAPRESAAGAPGAMHMLALLLAQTLCLTFITEMVFTTVIRTEWFTNGGNWMRWTAWFYPAVWLTLAQLTLMLRGGDRAPAGRVLAILAVALSSSLTYYLAPNPRFWSEPEVAASAAQEEPLHFTQDLIEEQAPLLAEQLDALKPQRPGVADMYTITFAPYEGEEVFRRESRMVSEVVAKRFDAAGRGLQLLNHREHLENMAWATPVTHRTSLGEARRPIWRHRLGAVPL